MGFGVRLLLLMAMAAVPTTSVPVKPTPSVPVKPTPSVPVKPAPTQLSRDSFPAGFVFGCSSSAYQYEGGWNLGGRAPSMWDTYTQQHPERILDGSNGNEAIDSYHLYEEDVSLLKDLNMDAYRFSISWSRILFNGQLSGGINQEGIDYYNNLIDALISKGLTPYVTIFHWDVPQNLEQLYGGFLGADKIIEDYKNYADVCFKHFGDRVKHWITINEPLSFCQNGYSNGVFAPGRCSGSQLYPCLGGDSATEPYIVAHNLLLAHATAVKLYKENYKEQEGQIGIALNSYWFLPMSRTKDDSDAVRRSLDWMLGLFLDPLTYGDYPFTMRVAVRDRLPLFTKEQSEMLKGSFDFLGLNYYTTLYAQNIPFNEKLEASFDNDKRALQTGYKDTHPIGPLTGSQFLFLYPAGIKGLLLYIKKEYGNLTICITENGVSDKEGPSETFKQVLQDDLRIHSYDKHLSYVKEAISEGVQVKGYFAWSLCDNFEWNSGYTQHYGIYYVDLKTKKRYPKKSAHWFANFLKK